MPIKPVNSNSDPLYKLLREGRVKDFNDRKKLGEKINLTSCDFRGLDLRGLDAKGLDLSDCYFRQADLRGIDFSETRLEGASINGAHVSGTCFPKELSAEELTLSLLHGTRMRYRTP
jgi:uncharacterized protein YjbI with pentapeptide repeats